MKKRAAEGFFGPEVSLEESESMDKEYRALAPQEIAQLERQGCRADDWSRVVVASGFQADFLHQVCLGGAVCLGANGAPVSGLIERPAGIYHATLYDCRVGDQVLISNVGRFIVGYDIGDGVVIENVGQIICEGLSTFGNGVEVSSINEAGGREVPIYDGLTAQIAYMMAMYRHRTATIARLTQIIAQEVASKRAARGYIGAQSVLINTTSLVNVRVGECATINGALELSNGTVGSLEGSPSYVGAGVAAHDFIMAPSSRVDTGSLLRYCFVGEGVLIENGFSAEHSLFFANCHCSHGEACSVFAAPYTVSHHRSTLLIAGYFLFFNAGSGANQSNHMYKTGPVHQGVHLRGCKFGSDAYVLLPAFTGVYTLVTGRHYSHHDTDDLPFSYLLEQDDQTYLVPGMNLRSAGVVRDIGKWPGRDRRVGVAHDLLHYDLMSPYIGGKILKAIKLSIFLMAKYPTMEVLTWNRVKIKMTALRKGLLLYQEALRSYLGELFAGFGPELPPPLNEDMGSEGSQWVDLAGMFLPKPLLGELLESIDRQEIGTVQELSNRLTALYDRHDQSVQSWAWYALAELLEKPQDRINVEDIKEIIRLGERDRAAIAAAVKLDAGRDQALLMAVSYGVDAEKEREADFRAVRGR